MSEHLKTLLEKTDVPKGLLEDDLKWMDNVGPMKDFLKWMENCVSERNCITPREIAAHQTLAEHDKLLDDESLESKFEQEFAGDLSITSYQLETKVLENNLIGTQKRLEIITATHKELVENNQRNCKNLLLCKVDNTLEKEAKSVRALVAGDYHKALKNLATSNTSLSNKLHCVARNGSPPGTIGFTNLDRLCGLVEDLKLYISLCTNHFQEEMEKEKNKERDSLGEFDTPNLSRLFNDSIKVEIMIVELTAEIEGLSAAVDHLRSDASTSIELPRSAHNEEIYSQIGYVCHEKMMVTMKGLKQNQATQKRLRKEELKPKMERAVELAKRMKLIGDAIIRIVKEERAWVLSCQKMISETLQGLEEEFEDVHSRLDNIQRVRTVHDLSVSNHSSLHVPSANASSFIGGLSTLRGVNQSINMLPANTWSIRHLTNPVVSEFKSFEEQARKALVCSKSLYNGLFRGPSATPQSLHDYVSTVLCTKENLEGLEQKWGEINCLQAMASPAEPIQLLLDTLCFMYLKDPEDFFVVVNRIEEKYGKSLDVPSFCQTQDISLLNESA